MSPRDEARSESVDLWDNLGGSSDLTAEAAQSKRPDATVDAPHQQSMRAGIKPAQQKAPSSDQKKIRRKQAGWPGDAFDGGPGRTPDQDDKTTFCKHCGRPIKYSPSEGWYDPEATGDDRIWRNTCDSHDTFTAEHEPESDSTKESTKMTSTQPTEAELLTRLAAATTLVEQSALSVQIDDLRRNQRESAASLGAMDWDNLGSNPVGDLRAHMEHAASLEHGLEPTTASVRLGHTDATDWLDDVVPTHTEDAVLSAQVRATATRWWTEDLWAPVKADTAELSSQVHSAAARAGSGYGMQATAAASIFTDHVRHLASREGITIEAEWGKDPFDANQGPDPTVDTYVSDGKTSQPVGTSPSNVDTFDDDDLGGGGGQDPKSTTNEGEAKSLGEGSTPETGSQESVDNPNYGQSGQDKSQWAPGSTEDKMNTQSGRKVAEGQTCKICGDSIAKDPAGENPSTWHHTNGTSHDHEAQPSSDSDSSKESSLFEQMRVAFGSNARGIETYSGQHHSFTRTAEDPGGSAETASEAPSLDEGDQPETGHSESPVQDSGQGATDQSGPTDSDRPGGGIEWGNTDGAATNQDGAYTSALSSNGQTFVAALSSIGSLDESIGGVTGRQIASLLCQEPGLPEGIREALRGGGNPFGGSRTAVKVGDTVQDAKGDKGKVTNDDSGMASGTGRVQVTWDDPKKAGTASGKEWVEPSTLTTVASKTAEAPYVGKFYCKRCGMRTETDDLSVIGRNCSATAFEKPHQMVPVKQSSKTAADDPADNDYSNVSAQPGDFRPGKRVYVYDYENWNGSGEPEIVSGTVVEPTDDMDEVLVRWDNGVESPEFYRRLFPGSPKRSSKTAADDSWPDGRWIASDIVGKVSPGDPPKFSMEGPDGEKREGYVWVPYDKGKQGSFFHDVKDKAKKALEPDPPSYTQIGEQVMKEPDKTYEQSKHWGEEADKDSPWRGLKESVKTSAGAPQASDAIKALKPNAVVVFNDYSPPRLLNRQGVIEAINYADLSVEVSMLDGADPSTPETYTVSPVLLTPTGIQYTGSKTALNKSARNLEVGDYVEGKRVAKVDKDTNPGVVYVWFDGSDTSGKADKIYNHGDPVPYQSANNGGGDEDNAMHAKSSAKTADQRVTVEPVGTALRDKCAVGGCSNPVAFVVGAGSSGSSGQSACRAHVGDLAGNLAKSSKKEEFNGSGSRGPRGKTTKGSVTASVNYGGPGYYALINGTNTFVDGPSATKEQMQKVIDDNSITNDAYSVVYVDDSNKDKYEFLPDKGNSKVPAEHRPEGYQGKQSSRTAGSDEDNAMRAPSTTRTCKYCENPIRQNSKGEWAEVGASYAHTTPGESADMAIQCGLAPSSRHEPMTTSSLSTFSARVQAGLGQIKVAKDEYVMCPECARHITFNCAETVGTCPLCHRYGDICQYNGSPAETVCLECLLEGKHMKTAHNPAINPPIVGVQGYTGSKQVQADGELHYSPVPGDPFRVLPPLKKSPDQIEKERLFPNGIPLRGELTEEQQAWLKRRGSLGMFGLALESGLSRLAAPRPDTFSLSDAKNDDGEWIMSPEQIRAEQNASDSYDRDEWDPYGDDDGYYGSRKQADLVKGKDLRPEQRREVLNAFPYRWTHENSNREHFWNTSVPDKSQHPTIPLQSDEEWLNDHAFHVRKSDGGLIHGRGAEPHYMADDDKKASLQTTAVAWGRRHYEDLAETISSLPDGEREKAAKHFATHLRGTNPNYRPEQFETAASTKGYRVRGGTASANYTRGHYQSVADAISSYPGDKAALRQHFVDHFGKSNARFKPDTFNRASA